MNNEADNGKTDFMIFRNFYYLLFFLHPAENENIVI